MVPAAKRAPARGSAAAQAPEQAAKRTKKTATRPAKTRAKASPSPGANRAAVHGTVAKAATTRSSGRGPGARPPARTSTTSRGAVKQTAARARPPKRATTRPPRRGRLRVTLEVGPKGKKVVAVAPDWPGLERGASTADAAIATLLSYIPRYAKVARRARLHAELDAITGAEVVERYQGSGSTDFWAISFAFSRVDGRPMSKGELARELALMRSCWAFFDDVRRRVSPEMRKGPRGGGRDRDRIVRHVLAVEQDWARKVGVRTPGDAVVTDDAGLKAYRAEYCRAIRSHHAKGQDARNWPLRYLIRHTAYHTMDHAWEMEDKDLTGSTG